MRKILLLLPALVLASHATLHGQKPKVSVSPVVGYIWPSSIFDERQTRVVEGEGSWEFTRHLTVSPTLMFGARVEFQSGGWIVGVEGSRGGETGSYYETDQSWDADGVFFGSGSMLMELRPTVTAVGVSVGRRIRTHRWLPDLGLEVGTTWYRFARLGGTGNRPHPLIPCEVYGPCTEWHPRYDIPSVTGGASLRKGLTSFSELHVGAEGSFGRTTKETAWTHYRGPGRKMKVGSYAVTAGISVTLPHLEPVSRESRPTPPTPVAP